VADATALQAEIRGLDAGRKFGAALPYSLIGLPAITPRVLIEALATGGGEAKRAFAAMMGMRKIDIATIKAARRR
jgi:hypothetical protein